MRSSDLKPIRIMSGPPVHGIPNIFYFTSSCSSTDYLRTLFKTIVVKVYNSLFMINPEDKKNLV